MGKKLLYISRCNSLSSPHNEICLPALARDGWDITVLAPFAEESIMHKHIPYTAKFRNLPTGGRAMEIATAKAILRARISGYSVLYLHSQSLATRAAIWLTGPKMGLRIAYHNPDYYDPFSWPLHRWLESYVARKADLNLNNEFHRAYIARADGKLRSPIVTAPIMLPAAWPFPAPVAEIRKQVSAAAADNPFVLVLHGGYSEVRAVPELFKALSMLPDRFRLVMFQKEHCEAETTDILNKLGLSHRVLRLPGMPLDGLLNYTVNCDAGVLLYKNNDLGNFFTAPGRLTEYIGAGIPVLASNHTGLENIVWRMDLGVTVNSKDPASIARGIELLAKLKGDGRYQKHRLVDAFIKHLAFDNFAGDIVASFNRLLNPTHCSNPPPPTFPWLKTSALSGKGADLPTVD